MQVSTYPHGEQVRKKPRFAQGNASMVVLASLRVLALLLKLLVLLQPLLLLELERDLELNEVMHPPLIYPPSPLLSISLRLIEWRLCDHCANDAMSH